MKGDYYTDGLKQKARYVLNRAIRSGRLERGPCSVCGSRDRVDGHHNDYSKPFDVIWLCRFHHRMVTLGKLSMGIEIKVDNPNTPPPPLTSKERLILRLLITGKTNKEIAATISVAEQSVKNYMRRIYMKIGVTSTRQMLPILEKIVETHLSTKD